MRTLESKKKTLKNHQKNGKMTLNDPKFDFIKSLDTLVPGKGHYELKSGLIFCF